MDAGDLTKVFQQGCHIKTDQKLEDKARIPNVLGVCRLVVSVRSGTD